MPALKWLPEAVVDLERLHRFLASKSPDAARKAARAILDGANQLESHPKIGKPLDDQRRELFVAFGASAYVLRYRIDAEGNPVVIRVRHGREGRE